MSKNEMRLLNLTLFGAGAGGAGGGAGAGAGGASGVGSAAAAASASSASSAKATGDAAPKAKGNTPAKSKGKGPINAPKPESKTAAEAKTKSEAEGETFDDLINGRYKSEYDKNVQDIVTKRLKTTNATLERITPIIQTLGEKYGIDASDLGTMDVDGLKSKIGSEIEAANQAKAQEAQQDHQRMMQLMRESTKLKQVYPGFNMASEIQNPDFARMLKAGVPVKRAYEAMHTDRIMAGAMKYTAARVKQMVSDSIQAGTSRPTENGIRPAPAGITDQDVKSKSYRENIKARVKHGEKVFL